MNSVLKKLLQAEVITKVPQEDRESGIYSRIFLVQKSSGDYIAILDLRKVNTFLKEGKFKMVSLNLIIQEVQPGDWMVSIDLRDAYLHMPYQGDTKDS
ncbi:hypothetical protein FKM82_024599 [Ascaphus truei]